MTLSSSGFFSMKIDGILKNCSYFIDYRLLMLYRILLNVCIQQEDILHYLTALTESKSVQKCRSYSRATLSSSAWKLIEFLRIDHVASTIHSWCVIGYVVTFAFKKRTYCTTIKYSQNQNRFRKCRSYSRATFSSSGFFYENWWNF